MWRSRNSRPKPSSKSFVSVPSRRHSKTKRSAVSVQSRRAGLFVAARRASTKSSCRSSAEFCPASGDRMRSGSRASTATTARWPATPHSRATSACRPMPRQFSSTRISWARARACRRPLNGPTKPAASGRAALAGDALHHREQVLRSMGQLAEHVADLTLVLLVTGDVDRHGHNPDHRAALHQRFDPAFVPGDPLRPGHRHFEPLGPAAGQHAFLDLRLRRRGVGRQDLLGQAPDHADAAEIGRRIVEPQVAQIAILFGHRDVGPLERDLEPATLAFELAGARGDAALEVFVEVAHAVDESQPRLLLGDEPPIGRHRFAARRQRERLRHHRPHRDGGGDHHRRRGDLDEVDLAGTGNVGDDEPCGPRHREPRDEDGDDGGRPGDAAEPAAHPRQIPADRADHRQTGGEGEHVDRTVQSLQVFRTHRSSSFDEPKPLSSPRRFRPSASARPKPRCRRTEPATPPPSPCPRGAAWRSGRSAPDACR